MNQRIKYVIVAVNNRKVVYANTNISDFVKGFTKIDPNVNKRAALSTKLKKHGVYTYISRKTGLVYDIYMYLNPNYIIAKDSSKV